MTNKKYVFLFPGQGAQYPSMGIDFFDAFDEVKDLFARASEIMGRDMRKLISEADAETLKRGDIAQPSITLVNLSAAAALKSRGVTPSACAGHSLGEYAALAVCGVISAEDSLRLTARRGELMQKAAAAGGGMAAVIGLSSAEVEKALAEWTSAGHKDLYIANLNSPRQTVVSGSSAALNEAEAWFKEAGAKRFIKLAVAGPFHCPLMTAAADEFAAVLDSAAFSDPSIPFFSNVTGGQLMSGGEAKSLALRQICGAVRWLDEETAIAASNPDAALEAGPGKALTGLWKDSGASAPCLPAGTLAGIDNINEWAKTVNPL
ncbi:MAG: ACP S-malonyltransferase [Spirochaetaceae bacterium]|jgi:[acyl-carrier-protein] S-malonyltransferase|nr:ACP S-malonyltransferase [Spirochaetaceae bacterium]